MPSMSGSIMSSITRSSVPAERKFFSALSPFPTASTVIPSRSRAIFKMSLTAGSSSTISILGIWIRLRQLNLDCCADSFSRADGDVAPHTLSELFTNRKSQAEAFRASLSPVEALENVGKVDRAYPGSFVFHRNGATPHAQSYVPTPDGMLDSVAEQDQEHLLEPLGIRTYAGAFTFDAEPEPRALYEWLHQSGRPLTRCLQVDDLLIGLPQIPTHAR